MSSPHHGRHEAGQNFVHDRAVIRSIVDIVSRTNGPIVEIGAGDGALTLPLQTLGRPLTAIEIDGRRAARLSSRTAASTRVVAADFLHYRLPRAPHVIVGNLPFHLTTAMLRRILPRARLDRRRAAGAVGSRASPRCGRWRYHDDRPVVAMVRIRPCPKGSRRLLPPEAQRGRRSDDDRPSCRPARRPRRARPVSGHGAPGIHRPGPRHRGDSGRRQPRPATRKWLQRERTSVHRRCQKI